MCGEWSRYPSTLHPLQVDCRDCRVDPWRTLTAMKPATSKLHQPAMVIASHSYMASIWLLYGYICCYQQGTNLSEQAIWTTHALRMVWVWDPQLHQLHQNHHFPCAPVEEVAMCRAKCSLLSEPGWLEPWHQQVPKYTLVKAKCWNPKLVWNVDPIVQSTGCYLSALP